MLQSVFKPIPFQVTMIGCTLIENTDNGNLEIGLDHAKQRYRLKANLRREKLDNITMALSK